MTRFAFVADVHGRGDRLARVLADARAQHAGQVIGLGDIGGTGALDLLEPTGARCAFGNWEASGLRGLPSPYRSWVARWPARIRENGFWAAHASPEWPNGLEAAGVVDYLRVNGLHWTALFPSLHRSDRARWDAFAELEATGVPLFFHGHTHVQEAWCWPAGGAPMRVDGAAGGLRIEDGERWLIGVGSVGDPHDGAGACYTLYDPAERRVTWRRV